MAAKDAGSESATGGQNRAAMFHRALHNVGCRRELLVSIPEVEDQRLVSTALAEGATEMRPPG